MKTQWYKKWWIWLIAVLVIAGAVVGILAATGAFGGQKDAPEPKPIETTVAVTTEAPTTTAAPTTVPQKLSIDDIIKQGYQKVGYIALYNNINNYKGTKILTAVEVKDTGENAFYSILTGNKTLSYYKFILENKDDMKDVKKGECVVVYGEVNEDGLKYGTIEVENCKIALTGDEAKAFFDSLEDEKPKEPTTAPITVPATTVPATTVAPTTIAPTTVPATTAPATEPVTTQPATKADENVIYNEKGMKVTYKYVVRNELAYEFVVEVENKSGKDLYLGTKDSTINGTAVDLIACDLIENGKTATTSMFILRSDLAEGTTIENLKFKFRFDDPTDWDNPIISKDITLTPDRIIDEHITK